MIMFVTGVSGAGKTTLAKELLDAPNVVVYDIDDEGTPFAGHLDWLRWRAAELLYLAVTEGEPGDAEHTVICGISWPHTVIDSNAWPEAEKAGAHVEFIMLDVPVKVMRRRLAERWASRSEKERRELVAYNRQLAKVLRRQVTNQRFGRVLDATIPLAELAARVKGRLEWTP